MACVSDNLIYNGNWLVCYNDENCVGPIKFRILSISKIAIEDIDLSDLKSVKNESIGSSVVSNFISKYAGGKNCKLWILSFELVSHHKSEWPAYFNKSRLSEIISVVDETGAEYTESYDYFLYNESRFAIKTKLNSLMRKNIKPNVTYDGSMAFLLPENISHYRVKYNNVPGNILLTDCDYSNKLNIYKYIDENCWIKCLFSDKTGYDIRMKLMDFSLVPITSIKNIVEIHPSYDLTLGDFWLLKFSFVNMSKQATNRAGEYLLYRLLIIDDNDKVYKTYYENESQVLIHALGLHGSNVLLDKIASKITYQSELVYFLPKNEKFNNFGLMHGMLIEI